MGKTTVYVFIKLVHVLIITKFKISIFQGKVSSCFQGVHSRPDVLQTDEQISRASTQISET